MKRSRWFCLLGESMLKTMCSRAACWFLERMCSMKTVIITLLSFLCTFILWYITFFLQGNQPWISMRNDFKWIFVFINSINSMYDFLLCNFYMLICLVLNVEISIMALNYCDIESWFFYEAQCWPVLYIV